VKARWPKRLYKQVEVTGAGPYGITLDGRLLRTPLKRELSFPSRPLAEAVAAEWAGQGERIDAETMWLTKLANTSIDRVQGNVARVIGDIVDYAGSDLVCYRAAEPGSLTIRQGEFWDPVLSWAEQALGVIFITVEGVVHQPQPKETLHAIRQYLARFDAMQLCALHALTTLTGSALIALIIAAGGLEPERGWLTAHVDEDWQIERWGEDAEAFERRNRRKQEFDAAVRFLALLKERPAQLV
jgi:chaperone required for assembly of F1-ATPase